MWEIIKKVTLWGRHRSGEEQFPISHPLRSVSMRGAVASDLEQKYINVFASSQSIKYISISILTKYNNVFTSSRSMKMNISNSVVIDHFAMSIKNVHRNTKPKTFLHCVFTNVSSNEWAERMHYRIDCICSTFPTVSFQMCPQMMYICM